MKKVLYILVGISLLFASCSTEDHTINFTFLQLNDVYEIAPLEGGKVGGMARVEKLHQDLLKENPNKIIWTYLSKNPSIFELVVAPIYKEELIAAVFHPTRFARYLYEFEFDMNDL